MPNYRNNLGIYMIPTYPLVWLCINIVLVATAVDMYETICKKLSNFTFIYLENNSFCC